MLGVGSREKILAYFYMLSRKHPHPVGLSVPKGTGTGFYVDCNKIKNILTNNKRVVQ